MIEYCDQAQGSNRVFFQDYQRVHGKNAHFDIGSAGQHDWATWGPQLAALSNDLAAAIR
jgi:S-formylglutathione hydrolase FrmB